MNVTHVVTSAIGIENIDSERSTRVVFGNRKSNIWGQDTCGLPVVITKPEWRDART